MAQLNAKSSLVLGVLAGIGASVCCVGPLVLLALGIGGAWVGNLTALETIPACFRRRHTAVSWPSFPQALSGPAGLRTRHAVRRPAHRQAAAHDVLVCRRADARPVGRAVARAAALLKEILCVNC